jgi:hypothetical protein
MDDFEIDFDDPNQAVLYVEAYYLARWLFFAECASMRPRVSTRDEALGRLLEQTVRRFGEDRRGWARAIIDAGVADAKAGRPPRC